MAKSHSWNVFTKFRLQFYYSQFESAKTLTNTPLLASRKHAPSLQSSMKLRSGQRSGFYKVNSACAAFVLAVAASPSVGQVVEGTFARLSHVGPAMADNNMNAIAFRASALQTVGTQQFVTYFDDDRTVVVGRRTLGTDNWEIFDTGLEDIHSGGNDDHNVISFGIDGDGRMHMSWGMHNNPLLYATSTAPVIGTNPITFNAPTGMTGVNENRVTYPQFFNAEGGDLLFLYRNGSSGNGDTQLNRYDSSSDTWQSIQKPLFDGEVAGDGIPSLNAYPQTWGTDSQGTIHFTWTSRFQGDSPAGESGYQTNHNFFYAKSPDEGVTWERSDGSVYAPIVGSLAPISEANAEVVIDIPEGSSLINQADMTIDNNDRPVLASWWAPDATQGDHTRQYMLGWYDGAAWQISQITDRPFETKKSEAFVRDLGRPIVMVDDDNRTIVAMRYKEAGNVITIAHSTDRQNWQFLDLTTEDLGVFEPTFDRTLWDRENKLNILYQPVETGPSTTVLSVLEWDSAAYFDSLSAPLKLSINRFTGDVSLLNPGDSPVAIDGYSIGSSAGSLAVEEWLPLSTQGGSNWDTANQSEQRLSELNAMGSRLIGAGESIPLGSIFSPEQISFGQDVTSDLGIQYTSADGATRNGLVEYYGESMNNLILEVDADTGRARLVNTSEHSVFIDAYVVTSESESLDPSDTGWISLADSGALGGGWDEANPKANRLSELQRDGASQLAPGQVVELGLLFQVGGTADLQLEFLQANESTTDQGVERFRQLGIPGDYNNDGVVTIDDYTRWRDNLGSNVVLANDLTPGTVTEQDYEVWRTFFGFTRQAALGQVLPLPSPPSMSLLALATGLMVLHRRHPKI